MSGLLSVGTRALQANQVVLQTAGNNIANVNTPGYSRQSVVLQTTQGQFTGGGYIGKGVDVQTIQRNFSAFLTRQSALASAAGAADSTRADKLKQLEGIFPGGTAGLGAAVNDMLNAFSDVANAPTDLTARTVALTRVDEAAKRMQAASKGLDDLQSGVAQELSQKVSSINSLAQSIAAINDKIARTQGSGQPPNDLLDQRDQLVRDLNQYVQTTSIAASDGTVGIFLAGSQALVLGSTVSPVSIVKDDFGDPLKSKLAITSGAQVLTLDENALGGGEVAGLLRFQNNDLVEGRNLLGRLTLAVSTSMNNQHQLGLDLDGNVGGNLFSAPTLPDALSAAGNTGSVTKLGIAVADPTKLVATDYQITYTTPTDGTVTRLSDNKVFTFGTTDPSYASAGAFLATEGLSITPTGTPAAGDRFLLKPFSTAASNISAEFSAPRALAVSSPVAASLNSTNKGTLAVSSLSAKTVATPSDVYRVDFTGTNTFNIVNVTTSTTVATAQTYVSGKEIAYTPAPVPPSTTPVPGWSLTLSGVAAIGDSVKIEPQPAAYRNLNAGNASAMAGLRDVAMFDGSALSDGYASLISQIGIRAQSANYSAQVSSSIAANLEQDRTSVSGVNLDEEAAKLLQYQQAYQASAKMIQIAQAIFDTLIQTLR
jgi:flagellar hook-associated protein 1